MFFAALTLSDQEQSVGFHMVNFVVREPALSLFFAPFRASGCLSLDEGDHAWIANSILGRISALYSGGKILSLRHVKVLLKRPNREFAEDAALATCADEGLRSAGTKIPKSFSCSE